jgi:hypothetical protein
VFSFFAALAPESLRSTSKHFSFLILYFSREM